MRVKATYKRPLFILAAVLLLPAAYFLYSSMHRPDPMLRVAKNFARNTGLSEKDFLRFQDLVAEMHKHALTESEWTEYERFVNSPAIEFRANAAAHLRALEGTAFQERARADMRKLANDPVPEVRVLPLIELAEVKDPQAESLLEENTRSSNAYLRQNAIEILHKYEKGERV